MNINPIAGDTAIGNSLVVKRQRYVAGKRLKLKNKHVGGMPPDAAVLMSRLDRMLLIRIYAKWYYEKVSQRHSLAMPRIHAMIFKSMNGQPKDERLADLSSESPETKNWFKS